MDIQINEKTVVVFDLDDTLYNELDFLISAYKEIADYLEDKNSKELFSIMFSLYRNKKNAFEYLEKVYNVSKEKLISLYINHMPNIKLSVGALDLINNIKKRKGKVALITDGRSVTQRNKIESLGLNNMLDFISISEEIGYSKPSEKSFLLIEDYFKLDNYFYIADNHKKDFFAPNKLKWTTIEVLDNGKNIHSNSYLYDTNSFYRAKRVIFNLEEVKIN